MYTHTHNVCWFGKMHCNLTHSVFFGNTVTCSMYTSVQFLYKQILRRRDSFKQNLKVKMTALSITSAQLSQNIIPLSNLSPPDVFQLRIPYLLTIGDVGQVMWALSRQLSTWALLLASCPLLPVYNISLLYLRIPC